MNAVQDLLPYVRALKNDIESTLARFGTSPPVTWGQLIELVERCQLANGLFAVLREHDISDSRIDAFADHVEDHTEHGESVEIFAN